VGEQEAVQVPKKLLFAICRHATSKGQPLAQNPPSETFSQTIAVTSLLSAIEVDADVLLHWEHAMPHGQ
jgi:hypothetical protein